MQHSCPSALARCLLIRTEQLGSACLSCSAAICPNIISLLFSISQQAGEAHRLAAQSTCNALGVPVLALCWAASAMRGSTGSTAVRNRVCVRSSAAQVQIWSRLGRCRPVIVHLQDKYKLTCSFAAMMSD